MRLITHRILEMRSCLLDLGFRTISVMKFFKYNNNACSLGNSKFENYFKNLLIGSYDIHY